MKLIFRYMKRHWPAVALAIFIKLIGTLSELALPYILEHIIDDLVPLGVLQPVLFWGCAMFLAALVCRTLNVLANTRAIHNGHIIGYEIRQALFEKTINLSGSQFDTFGLPSLISRMTSDSYNVQSEVVQLQSLCVRSPIMLIGGICVAMLMDTHLAMVLVCILPIMIVIIILVSAKGIPLYTVLQEKLDTVVRMMRENITGIRVVKALCKEDYEKQRFAAANDEMTRRDMAASAVMSLPWPMMQLFLNIGLTMIVLIGAARVNAGAMRPGVILAFLTYVNMIAMGIMGLNRIFMTLSKASASANRIDEVLQAQTPREAFAAVNVSQNHVSEKPLIVFDRVCFTYGGESAEESRRSAGTGALPERFAGEAREMALSDISFSVKQGDSLGIIGPTGCGKTTIVNLLMGFYMPVEGSVRVAGKETGDYEPDALRRKFGTAFQNDIIFQDTLRENIDFGRGLTEEALRKAAGTAMILDFIDSLPEGLDHQAAIRGADLSGGQKQRILIARALAANPEILVLDDSSSALDYQTDASMRQAVSRNYPGTTTVLIAQRISSVMNMTHILVMDDGKCIGYGTHEELLKTCAPYREIYEVQMGAMAE